MSKIIILGGSGFIGTALRSLLDKQGVKYAAPPKTEIDLTDFHAWADAMRVVEDGDSVIMLAAYTNEKGRVPALTEANIRMAANMVAALHDRSISHFVYMSSDSVYGKSQGIISELTPICPDSLYGFMHATREQYFRELFPPDKLTILRPCAIYGVGDTHNAYGINQFVRDARKKKVITLFGQGEERRSNIHVEDVAVIAFLAAQYKIAGTLNVNCGRSWTFREIAEIIRSNMPDVIIGSKPRTTPVYHRHFDGAALTHAFFAPRLPEYGIPEMIRSVM